MKKTTLAAFAAILSLAALWAASGALAKAPIAAFSAEPPVRAHPHKYTVRLRQELIGAIDHRIDRFLEIEGIAAQIE